MEDHDYGEKYLNHLEEIKVVKWPPLSWNKANYFKCCYKSPIFCFHFYKIVFVLHNHSRDVIFFTWCDQSACKASLTIRKFTLNNILWIWAGIAQRYGAGLRAGGSRFRVSAGVEYFSLSHRVQTGSGAHPASYPMGIRVSFPGGKASGAWSWPLTSI
jgi:hypothetical protein